MRLNRDNEDDKSARPNTFTQMTAEKKQLVKRLFIANPHDTQRIKSRYYPCYWAGMAELI
jgi:hypothetical protein